MKKKDSKSIVKNKLPTAEEFQRNYSIEEYGEGGYLGINETVCSKMLVDFAKLHVQAALKEASLRAKIENDPYEDEFGDWHFGRGQIDQKSILDSYNLENIK